MNIRNRTLIIALAGLGILGASALSSAQMSTSVSQPIRVELGGFFPTDSSVTSTLRKAALAGGVSYDLYSGKQASSPTAAGLYVDASYNSSGGLHLTQVGVGVDGRLYAAGSNYGGQFYVGAGIGAYFMNANGFFSSTNNTRIGGKIFVGYEFSQGFFAEGGYTYIASVNGINPSGFQALLGYKF